MGDKYYAYLNGLKKIFLCTGGRRSNHSDNSTDDVYLSSPHLLAVDPSGKGRLLHGPSESLESSECGCGS